MNLLEVKTEVANYFNVALVDLTVLSQDMFLVAANQVRRRAELLHDFEFTRKLAQLTVNGVTGGSLGAAVEYGTASPTLDIKRVIEVGLFDDFANLRPVEWTTVAEGLERVREDNGLGQPRYPTDGWARSGPSGQGRFQFTGSTVFRFPKDADNNFTLGMEVYTFATDWVAGDLAGTPVTDTWTKYASQFLLWGSIVFLNHKFKEFVWRTEGNLAPPEKLRDEGLSAFVEWDAARYETNRRHGR